MYFLTSQNNEINCIVFCFVRTVNNILILSQNKIKETYFAIHCYFLANTFYVFVEIFKGLSLMLQKIYSFYM